MHNDDISNEELIYPISDNIVKEASILHIPLRNWIEAVIFAIVVACIILQIPFTAEARQAMLIVYCGFVFWQGLKGIKNRSVTEMLIDELKFIKNRRKLHLRGPEYAREKKEIKKYDIAYASYARRKYIEHRENLLKFANGRIEGYGGESDTQDNRDQQT